MLLPCTLSQVFTLEKKENMVPGNKGSKHQREIKVSIRIRDTNNLEVTEQEDEEGRARFSEKLECLIYLATLRVFITLSESLRMN